MLIGKEGRHGRDMAEEGIERGSRVARVKRKAGRERGGTVVYTCLSLLSAQVASAGGSLNGQ